MSGIDRLRAIAGAWDEWGLGGALADIAGQIERELREALKSDASDGSDGEKPSCPGCHDAADATFGGRKVTREDAEAIAWVRERGGMEAVEARLMPEGYEWPRYDTGEPVMFGDCVENRHGTCTVKSVRFYSGGGVTVYGEDSGAQFVVVTEPVMREPIKRAKRQVLAADGEPLEAGQTVWDVNTGDEFEVCELIQDDVVEVVVEYMNRGIAVHGRVNPETLTHRRPVLDADGVPIREGDTVWCIGGGEPAEVTYTIEADASHPDEVVLKGYEDDWPMHADQLTHTKPEPVDTWQRIEEDAENVARLFDSFDADASEDIRAIVRRCRALAERERGERLKREMGEA